MDFETLFGLFYTKYRGEESPPSAGDPEWEIAIRNYNACLDRLESFDDTRWNFLKTKLSDSSSSVILETGEDNWQAPDDMLYPGGLYWKIGNTRGVPRRIYDVQEVSLLGPNSEYAYFLGDQHNGYTFYLNPAVTDAENGYELDYIYYRKAERLDVDEEDGTSIIAGANPEFFYWSMAAQRFLDSRNFPAYQVAKRDAEEALKNMKLRNNSGDNWNPPLIMDAGPGWGF